MFKSSNLLLLSIKRMSFEIVSAYVTKLLLFCVPQISLIQMLILQAIEAHCFCSNFTANILPLPNKSQVEDTPKSFIKGSTQLISK